jgi:hypothetical protein
MQATYTDWIFKCKVKQELVGGDKRVNTFLGTLFLLPVDTWLIVATS